MCVAVITFMWCAESFCAEEKDLFEHAFEKWEGHQRRWQIIQQFVRVVPTHAHWIITTFCKQFSWHARHYRAMMC